MNALVKAYIEEIAEGRIPAHDSPERKAYEAWSKAEKAKRNMKRDR